MKKVIINLTVLFFVTAGCAFAQTGTKTLAGGVQCRILTANAGEKIKQNDVITFNIVQKTDKDSVLFSTYTQGQPVKIQIRPAANPADLMDVFPLLAAKDSAVVRVPVDSVFKGHEADIPPFLKKGGYLVFDIKIQQVQSLNDAIAERNTQLEKLKTAEAATTADYIKGHNLMPVTTASGLKYIVLKRGLSPRPQTGDTVLVNYTGRLVNGKVFDTSIQADAAKAGVERPGRPYEPIKFPVGTSRVIKGWDEGLLLLPEGSKAMFIVPSDLGYGQQGSGAIPPFSTLVFDIELVKVIRVKHAPAALKPAAKKIPVKKRAAVKKKI